MADESYGSVGTPRIYVDYVQYAKAIGMVKFYYGNHFMNVDGTYADAWDFNPSKTTKYQASGIHGYPRIGVVFNNSDIEPPPNFYYQGGSIQFTPPTVESTRDMQFRNLLSTINYGGVLNHDLGAFFNNANGAGNQNFRSLFIGTTSGSSNKTEILGDVGNSINDIGCTLFKHNYFQIANDGQYTAEDQPRLFEGLYLQIKNADSNEGNAFGGSQPILNLGALTIGRSFDLPHSADLSVNQTISYDGVQSKRTIGGSDLTQVNYLRPKWGDLAPWTNVDLDIETVNNNDFSTAGFQGRRSWDLSFSYISKEDMFPRSYSNNTAGYYEAGENPTFDDGDNSTGLYTDNVVNNWLNLTLGGQIPFIFQPDKDKATDFAIVKIDKPSMKIEQVAHQVYSFSVKLIEVF